MCGCVRSRQFTEPRGNLRGSRFLDHPGITIGITETRISRPWRFLDLMRHGNPVLPIPPPRTPSRPRAKSCPSSTQPSTCMTLSARGDSHPGRTASRAVGKRSSDDPTTMRYWRWHIPTAAALLAPRTAHSAHGAKSGVDTSWPYRSADLSRLACPPFLDPVLLRCRCDAPVIELA
jgi:hypothetical protein